MLQIEQRGGGIGLRSDEVLARLTVDVLRSVDFHSRSEPRRTAIPRDGERFLRQLRSLGGHGNAGLSVLQIHHCAAHVLLHIALLLRGFDLCVMQLCLRPGDLCVDVGAEQGHADRSGDPPRPQQIGCAIAAVIAHEVEAQARQTPIARRCERERCLPLSGEHLLQLADLVLPYLHGAWTRSLVTWPLERAGAKPVKTGLLTPREQQILQWIYHGKSNIEIGMILEISPLTVKNHVQKTLRKLNVLNRTQAVGKALALRIVNP